MNKKILALAIAGSTLSYGIPAYSQGLEEVIVTARKRVETVQDTPVAVRAMSAETLQRFEITSLEKVASMSPEFKVGRSSNGSGAQLTMRGIGSSSTSIGIEQSVAVIVDDIYYGQGRIINEGMFDLARVELLKGPQALFFGKNATAGTVSLTTADPTDEFESSIKVGYEFDSGRTSEEFIISGPATDTVLARLALRGTQMSDGYYENKASAVTYTALDAADFSSYSYGAAPAEADQPGEDELLGRLTLVVEPTDELTAKLKISATESETNNSSWNYQVFNSPTGNSSLNPANPINKDFVTYQNNLPNFIGGFPIAGNDTSLGNEYSSHQVTLDLDYALDSFTVSSATNYQYNKNTFVCACDFQSSNAGTWATEEAEWDAFSEELRLLSDFDSMFNFMVGVLYQKTNRTFEQHVAFAGVEDSRAPAGFRNVAVSKESGTDGETLSPFFQGMFDLTDTVELTVGARYTEETKESRFNHPYVNELLGGLWRLNEEAVGDQKFTDWSPEATLNWNATDDVMLFVSYKTAYKSGGFSNSGLYATLGSVEDFLFEPESSKGFEVGVKSTVMDNQLRLNATVYSYEYEDLQVDFFNSPVFAFTTLNAGSAETRGVELEAEYAPHSVEGLVLRAALNYNKAEYKDFIAPCWSGQTIAQGCNMVVPGTTGTPGQDISGASTSMAPEITASLGVDYEITLANGLGLGFSTNLVYSDDYNASAFDNPHAMRDSYVTVDAAARLMGNDESWEVSLLGKNLTDEMVITGVVDGPSTGTGTGTTTGVPADQIGFGGLPRTIALQFTKRFN